jgi:hypothetical protein
VPEFIPPSRPSPSGEGGNGQEESTRDEHSRIHVQYFRAFPGSTSPSLGAWQTDNRATMVRGSIPVAGRGYALKTPSPERPTGPSFAETPALSSLWPIALTTPDRSPRPRFIRQMGYVGNGSCRRTVRRAATSAEPETTGLEEIGGSTGAGSERTKIFAV